MQAIRLECDLFQVADVTAVDAGSARRPGAAAALDRGGSLLKHAVVNDKVRRNAAATGEANGRLCLLVLGLHAYRCMHRLVTHALCSVAACLALSRAAYSQASDPAAAPLRVGDRVLIKLWVDTTFADTVRIDETGNLVLPRLGSLCVRDIPTLALADSVRRAYTQVIRADAVEVIPLRRVTVLGEVRKPGTYFIEPRSTVRDAIAAAGGMTDISAEGRVVVLRGDSRLVFNKWQRRADADVVVRSGDVMWVDRESWMKRNLFSVISGIGVLFTIGYSLLR